jgi:hypothetical protein
MSTVIVLNQLSARSASRRRSSRGALTGLVALSTSANCPSLG